MATVENRATDASIGLESNGKSRFRDAMEGILKEPIAVVGMACRFPGANDVEAFWRLLMDGADAVTEGVPGSGVGRIGQLFSNADIQNDACRFGGYLDEVDLFDAAFFRISPVEAQFLDPQQRLMLETSWEALEDAAIDPEGLMGSRTGVYGGISTNDYRGMIMDSSDTSEPAASLYTVSGTSYNTAIGRVAYALGFRGPAIAIDTACSSSLVAVHQAVTGLQRGEADLALAGGVHTILSARLLELRGNAGMLSPDGRCKTYDASANGYVRGEGCGILILKRLSEAEEDGDRIWGVIRGSALNQDGASQGLTVPNADAQRQVIEDALDSSGIRASDVDYVEAHGTGTPVGDPIEMEALGAAFSADRDSRNPLLVGSVKTNFGHLEAAAGVAGMMKAILALKHGVIPKHLHFKEPNPEIDWDNMPVRVTAEATEWPDVTSRNRIAGVSGFGWSGTNAHVILEGYGVDDGSSAGSNGLDPNAGRARNVDVSVPMNFAVETAIHATDLPRSKRFLPLSGKTAASLHDQAESYLSWLEKRFPNEGSGELGEFADIAWTAGVGRSHFEYRAGVMFSDAASLKAALSEVIENGDAAGPAAAKKIAFVYTGQGSQWLGMGESLYEREPVVRMVLDRCEEVMIEERGVSLLDVMFGRSVAGGDLHDTAWTQPAVYALECALTALWSSIGIEPSVVIGHSLGEFAAARTAGVFGLEDGLRFVAKRGALLSSVPELGGMAAIFAPKREVYEAVREHNSVAEGPGLCVAVDNGVHQVVSGPVADIEAISERFEAEEIRVRRLRNQAFHSALVEPALDELEEAYGAVRFSAPELALISNVTGSVIKPDEKLDAGYWRRHARQSVEFQSGIDTMAELDVDLVIEVGPNAVLGPLVSMAWPGMTAGVRAAKEPAVLASLLRNYDDLPLDEYDDGFVTAVAGAYEAGLEIKFEGLFAGETRRRVSLPSYPFQRERFWVEAPRRKRAATDHPLLGSRHESPRGEVLYETLMFPTDPAWLGDHRVFGRVIMPGAMFGAMAASVSSREVGQTVEVEDLQLHNPMVFAEDDGDEEGGEVGRRVQLVFEDSDVGSGKRLEIYSRGEDDDEWTLHAEGGVADTGQSPSSGRRIDLAAEKSRLKSRDVAEFYKEKERVGIEFGPTFRSVDALWSDDGEAIGEVSLTESLRSSGLEAHPVLLDGCFQVLSAARNVAEDGDQSTYLPFGWERLWLRDKLPDRVVCHARMRESVRRSEEEDDPASVTETFTGDLRLYSTDGVELGGFEGYTIKRATRSALLADTEEIDDLLYEVVWRDRPLETGTVPADFLPTPRSVATRSRRFTEYLADEGVDAVSRQELLADLERLSWSFALATLEKLGWEREKGTKVEPEELRERLGVLPEHSRLFRRLFELLARAGAATPSGDEFVVVVGPQDHLPELMPLNVDEFADEMLRKYEHGSTEVGLFRRCAGALADTVQGKADALTLLFSSGEPTAADLYFNASASHASNRMLGDAMASMLMELPEGRRLRILEVGAGTGSATASVLPELPDGRFDYVYTDISAGFFAEAESKFGGAEASIEYRVLDIERSPIRQGFDAHSYDLVIASNVLHATRFLSETLENCLELLAPSGVLVALENLRGQGWMDLTFGVLDGWWRFADDIRPHHALAGPDIWKRALGEAGFVETAVLGPDASDAGQRPDRGVIMAQGPAEVAESPGVWILVPDGSGVALDLAAELAGRNQTVLLASESADSASSIYDETSGVVESPVEFNNRESWRSLLAELPEEATVNGIVHMVGLDGHGADASTVEFGDDTKRISSTALAMIQGAIDADVSPQNGVWFLTRGAQVLERENLGEVASAVLWGFGKVVDREAPQLQPRMIDLDPEDRVPITEVVDELLRPDDETHIAYRYERRRVARLERTGTTDYRLMLPDDSAWVIKPDESGDIEQQRVEKLPARPLAPSEVRVAVDAVGVNFRDAMVAMGMLDDDVLGGEVVGRVLEVGPDVVGVSEGDRVVGLCFRSFSSEVVTRAELLAPAPPGYSASALATMPLTFTTVALSFEIAKLKSRDKVLVHSGAGGVGLSAIQMAHAMGAEVFATASTRKQEYLRSIGVKHVFDSRQTDFGAEILEATDGNGVDVVLNSFTGEGYIDASLSCLTVGGRWIELAAGDILSEAEMAAVRPDVEYSILELDSLKTYDPVLPGNALRRVMEQVSEGELHPIAHSRWPLAEAGSAMQHMRSARHIGKLVLTKSPMQTGSLRADRTYLVTGGLGGIGIALAEWLADHGAGCIVLNGRREPDREAEEAIDALRSRGARIEVELADVTDTAAIDAMLERIDARLPTLGGIIHSVGVLSDAALANQSWERFEQVLWPKVLGAWHLHRSTMDRDLELFIMFSSVAGVLGNAGQANHAAANAFLDQLAGHRRAMGLPGQTIAWGAWSELGEAAEQRERIEGQLESVGTGWITPRQGIRAFEHLVRQDITSGMVASVDWPTFQKAHEGSSPLLEELLSVSSDEESTAERSTETLLERLSGKQMIDREEILVEYLQEELQAVMRLQSAPSSSVGFFDLGMDSLMAVELRNRLNRAFEGEYVASNTIVFDYPNVSEMAGHLAEELGDVGEEKQVFSIAIASTPEPSVDLQRNEDGIAIVGMAGRFPFADNLSQFWEMLESGTDAITDGRQGIGSWEGAVGDPNADDIAYRRGAFLSDIDLFDSRFFRISPIEARMMDPCQRMLLETSWEALEDAGIDPGVLRGSRTGVYAGVGHSEYRDLIEASGRADSYLGTTGSVTAGRVAFVLGLEGPALPVDAACASSLASVHQAVVGLRHGEVDMALAGGVNLALSRSVSRFMMDVGMLSPTGVCRPFDAAADGYVRGEACGMVVLKRLSDAEADGDRIWAIIRGSGVNQNGTSAGLTVPNGQAQQRVMRDALVQAGIVPTEVDYLETHTTGSEMADPIEVNAAAAVYGEGREMDQPLLLGSVKSNLGHTEWAAGVTALIKTVLSMNQGLIPKHLHFEDPNPHVDWDNLPIKVTTDNTKWPNGNDRAPIAAVNAFGMSGTNAHILVEGYREPDGSNGLTRLPVGTPRNISVSSNGVLQDSVTNDGQETAPRAVRLLPLSGRSAGALRDMAIRYIDLLNAQEDAVSDNWLSDLAWTASVGRSHFEHRAGVVFDDIDSLERGLNHVVDNSVSDDESTERVTRRVASIYLDNGVQDLDIAKALYETEPVVRSVFDRCEVAHQELRGASLIQVLRGQTETSDADEDLATIVAAIYAFNCALTALWFSVGVNPRLVFGKGFGEVSAAQATGAFDLEDGLRLSTALGTLAAARAGGESFEAASEALNTVLSQIAWSEPTIPLFSASTGKEIRREDLMNVSHWSAETVAGPGVDEMHRLRSSQVDLVLKFGQGSDASSKVDWPIIIGALDGTGDSIDSQNSNRAFVSALAEAYESGLALTWDGLFAGEQRCRIGLPTYPFQRRRHWF